MRCLRESLHDHRDRGDAHFTRDWRMTGKRDFRVGIVGCGRISQFHIEAISKVEGLTLVAVCDTDQSRARAAGEKAGVPSFGSLDAMLKGAELDIVAVCTPSGLHPEHGIAAAKAGKHVVSEKPMALSLDAAQALIDACDTAGTRLFVVKQNRLNPPVQLLKRAVDRGRFGRIFVANVTVR